MRFYGLGSKGPARFGLALVILGLLALGNGGTAWADSLLLESSDGQVSIDVDDFAQFIQQRVPEQHHRQLVRDHSRLNSLLRSLFMQKRMFLAAQGSGHVELERTFFEVEPSQRDSAIRQHITAHIESQLNASYASAARDYFDLNRSEFNLPEKRAFSYVQFSSPDHDAEWLHVTASQAYTWLVENAAALEDIPPRYSEREDLQVRGATLELQERERFLPAFAKAGFALANIGDVSDPVAVDDLVHIIRLDELRPASVASFEDVEESLNERMRRRHAERIRERYRNEMVTDEEVVINSKALQNLEVLLKQRLGLWHEFGS